MDAMSVEDVFREYKNRHAAMAKALTSDVEHFYHQCDPGKENLCLYGFQNGEWQVDLPADEVPPELPEPALGINFARDGMHRKDWLSLVAVHSDAWLYAVAFYHGARFNKSERRKLFDMINDLPTLFEIVSRTVKEKKKEEKHHSSNHNNSRKGSAHNSNNKGTKRAVVKREEEEEYDDEEDDEDGNEDGEHEDTYCGSCGDQYTDNQFWIACDICEKWYHGTCVKMTERKAQQFDQYKCPSCANKKARI